MIQELKTLTETSNPLYEVEYEENKMMNLKADEKSLNARFAYIEEFVQGSYTRTKFQKQKITQVQIYFCRFAEFQNSAMDRETLRNQIESEIVFPFMERYNASGIFDRVDNFKFYTPLPRFDANEVSIMLQFDCKQNMC
jgi:hypothetical protein